MHVMFDVNIFYQMDINYEQSREREREKEKERSRVILYRI